MKKILLTGSTGFIGRNLIAALENKYTFLTHTRQTKDEELRAYLHLADYVVHLAGVSRPQDPQEFYEGNSDLTKKLTDIMLKEKVTIPIFYTSSIHAIMDNDFGKSKRLAEDHLIKYASILGSDLYIVRLTNTFGRWARPNAHSVIATFCHNIAHDLPIQVSDPTKEITLAYVDDVTETIVNLLENKTDANSTLVSKHYYTMVKVYKKTLGQIVHMLQDFKENKEPSGEDEFAQKLYITYISYKD